MQNCCHLDKNIAYLHLGRILKNRNHSMLHEQKDYNDNEANYYLISLNRHDHQVFLYHY